ncbi:MAG: tRNA/tmRNA/rRNA uracil-C5-methylase (TrmA/RlmC/RlmD family), partial [Myxococcota bacterium]
VGLHPKVAKALATADADELIYVACSPASLGRDAVILQAGHWKLTDLWTVDLFPHTGHIEMVGRFVRQQS